MSKKLAVFFSLIFVFLIQKNARAELALIRDAETEKFLRELTIPVFKAAGLNPQNIKIYIINDDSINAFVSGGQNIFINTGLIRKYNTPDALIGVVAHESGHITSGHLARSSEGASQAEGVMLLSYLLGIGAVAAGSPDAGSALIMGGSQTAQRIYMKFTRTQEEAADQHAIEYLDKMKYPATGLVRLLEFFESEMIGYKDQIDEYMLSHPVSRKRIDLIKARTANKNFSDQKINQQLQPEMNRVLAKLEGFIENPDELLKKYKNRNDEDANYIKSIALFRKGKTDQSLKLLDEIIDAAKKSGKNKSELGFLFELKGQVLFESGQTQNSILAYNQADKNLSLQDSGITKISLAAGILALKTKDKNLIKLAITKLEEAEKFESDNPLLFRNLANAYSKLDDEARSLLALAEFNLLIGEKDKCRKYAKAAKEKFGKSEKTEILRADDLLELAKEEKVKN